MNLVLLFLITAVPCPRTRALCPDFWGQMSSLEQCRAGRLTVPKGKQATKIRCAGRVTLGLGMEMRNLRWAGGEAEPVQGCAL